jgi:hypothetical protein
MILEKAVVHEPHKKIQMPAIIDAFTRWVAR